MARAADRARSVSEKVKSTNRQSQDGVTFINAQLRAGEISSVRIVGSQIAALGVSPPSGDLIVDLQGDRLLPGLINAHDHLQLNTLPQLESHEHYRHVSDWIFDVDARRRFDPAFERGVAVSRDERLLIGGVKNLLSGVTTVAHHDPLYSCLYSPDYPVSVVAKFGWSHSLYIDGKDKVWASYSSTPNEWPWIIHASEGVDDEAASEFDRLDSLGCLKSNTLLVHGVALDHPRRARLAEAGAGLIWCPSSNLRLFGKTADIDDLVAYGCVTLGTDSRLSGGRDLLDELGVAGNVGGLDDVALESLVTDTSARLLRLTDRGVLQVGARADILVLPATARLSGTTRAEVRLVLLGGKVKYGDLDCARSFSPTSHWAAIQVDGRSKIIDVGIASRLSAANVTEFGLELPKTTGRAA
jgi:cytosine/adenosine deaminase-related metal-dependent hydrolase